MSFDDRTRTNIDPRQIRPDYDVYSADGEDLGDVEEVRDGYLVVRKGMIFPHEHFVPFSAITRVEHDRVYLSVTKDRIEDQGWDEAPRAAGRGTVDLRKIEHGWDVYAADGEKVGDVSEVTDGYLVVAKGFFFPKERYIPAALITRVEHDRVDLNVTRAALDAATWDGPPETTEVREPRQGFAAGTAGGRMGAGPDGPRDRGRREEARTVQLREEELRAEKRPVEAGEVQVRKDVVAEQQTIDVPVTREEVVIERRPVDRAEGERMGSGEFAAGETIRVPVREEQVTVGKDTVVTEEIEVGKRAVQDTEHISETVQREDVAVDHDDDVNVHHRQADVPHVDEGRRP